jgi:chromosome segregation ATPase
MKIILGIFLFFASIFSVIAQDKKGVSLFRPKNQDLVEQLSKQNDNLKRNLAEARREWQKARDAIQSIDSVYQEQLKNQEKAVLEGQESKEELNRSKIIWTDSIAVLHRIIDSLQRSSQVSTSQSLDEQSNSIKELLKIYPKSQYQIKV